MDRSSASTGPASDVPAGMSADKWQRMVKAAYLYSTAAKEASIAAECGVSERQLRAWRQEAQWPAAIVAAMKAWGKDLLAISRASVMEAVVAERGNPKSSRAVSRWVLERMDPGFRPPPKAEGGLAQPFVVGSPPAGVLRHPEPAGALPEDEDPNTATDPA